MTITPNKSKNDLGKLLDKKQCVWDIDLASRAPISTWALGSLVPIYLSYGHEKIRPEKAGFREFQRIRLCLQFRIFMHNQLLTLNSYNSNSSNILHRLLGADNTEHSLPCSLTLPQILWGCFTWFPSQYKWRKGGSSPGLQDSESYSLHHCVTAKCEYKHCILEIINSFSLQGFQEAELGAKRDLPQMLTTSVPLWVSAQRAFTLQSMGECEWNSS